MTAIKTKNDDIIMAEGNSVDECIDNYVDLMNYSGTPLDQEVVNTLKTNPWYGCSDLDIYIDED